MEFQSCFDIIGPIMVGPSSSHTAAVVTIGKFVHELLGGNPEEVEITLYGSFAETYQGHGTDKAILGGLLGMDTDDGRIRNAIMMASQQGMDYEFRLEGSCPYFNHPNTTVLIAKRKSSIVKAGGVSLGGGLSKIFMINDELCDIRLSTSDDIATLVARYNRDMTKEFMLKGVI